MKIHTNIFDLHITNDALVRSIFVMYLTELRCLDWLVTYIRPFLFIPRLHFKLENANDNSGIGSLLLSELP